MTPLRMLMTESTSDKYVLRIFPGVFSRIDKIILGDYEGYVWWWQGGSLLTIRTRSHRTAGLWLLQETRELRGQLRIDSRMYST